MSLLISQRSYKRLCSGYRRDMQHIYFIDVVYYSIAGADILPLYNSFHRCLTHKPAFVMANNVIHNSTSLSIVVARRFS